MGYGVRHMVYVSVAATPAAQASFPSGPWKGVYRFGRREHNVCEFALDFRSPGLATSGVPSFDVPPRKKCSVKKCLIDTT